MSEKEFAEWKQRMEEKIILIREESAEIRRQSDIRMAKLDKRFGGFIDTESVHLEDEFGDALREKGELGGYKLDRTIVRLNVRRKGITTGEYDIVGVNGDKVFVGEIKHKLTAEKVRSFGEKKLKQYGKHFPEDASKKQIIGMVGGLQIEEDAAEMALKMGMYVLRLHNRKLKVEIPK